MKKELKIGIIGLIAGILGSFAGADGTSKNWRRVGIPLLITACAYYYLNNLWVVTLMSLIGALSLGYGIPSYDDEGSSIGKIWYRITHQNHKLADICCRGHIAFIKSICLLSIPIIKHNWIVYLFISLGIIINDISWGGIVHPKQTFKLFSKTLLLEEFLIYSINTILALILIYI